MLAECGGHLLASATDTDEPETNPLVGPQYTRGLQGRQAEYGGSSGLTERTSGQLLRHCRVSRFMAHLPADTRLPKGGGPRIQYASRPTSVRYGGYALPTPTNRLPMRD